MVVSDKRFQRTARRACTAVKDLLVLPDPGSARPAETYEVRLKAQEQGRRKPGRSPRSELLFQGSRREACIFLEGFLALRAPFKARLREDLLQRVPWLRGEEE